MKYSFPLPPVVSLPVAGRAERFPVRRIFCVGRNYAAHAKEMGKDPDRDPPFFFTKPADAIVEDGRIVAYPPETQDFHYEAELVVAIGKSGTNIQEDRSRDHIFGYGPGEINETGRMVSLAVAKQDVRGTGARLLTARR